MRLPSWSGLFLGLGMLLGCYPRGNPQLPIPTLLEPAPRAARRLVVVLPGRADDLEGLRRSGIAQAVQATWPDADVLLTGLALGYYFHGNAVARLHREIMVPARQHHYAQVWLLGASLGGMGALLYDRAHPGDADGIVLLAPWLGEKPLLDEIRRAGGVANWQPGPEPAAIDNGNFQRELWRYIRQWTSNPGATGKVWLAWGDRDPLRGSMPLIAPLLPQGHVLVRPGGHAWSVWSPAAAELLERVDRDAPR